MRGHSLCFRGEIRKIISELSLSPLPTPLIWRVWSGGAMVLGKLPVPGRPTIWMIVGQGPTVLAVGAGGVVWTFLLSSIFTLLFLPLFGRRLDID